MAAERPIIPSKLDVELFHLRNKSAMSVNHKNRKRNKNIIWLFRTATYIDFSH